MRGSLPVLSLVLLVACPAPGADSHSPCVPPFAVFTDIDETLTTTDEEWLAQLGDPTHDPAMRPGADALMQGYAERGYTVFYVTARGERLALSDGRGAPTWWPADLRLAPAPAPMSRPRGRSPPPRHAP